MPNAVVAAILAATTDARLRAAMLMGSRLESGWNTTAVGDNNSSFGPFQIHLPAHPGVSAGEAQDPGWAVAYMMPAYRDGVSRVPASLWSSNPAQAAATAAFYAERPRTMYSTSNYTADWTLVQQALSGQDVGSAAGFSPQGGTGDIGGNTTLTQAGVFDSATWERNISDTLNYAFMIGIILGGIILMVAGIVILMKEGGDTSQPTIVVRNTVKVRKEKSNSDNSRPTGTQSSGSTRTTPKRTTASATRITRKQLPTRTTAQQSAGRPKRTVKVINP